MFILINIYLTNARLLNAYLDKRKACLTKIKIKGEPYDRYLQSTGS